MRQWTELETQMTSVDRVDEYSQLEPEGDLESPPDKRPPADWPSQGNIEFRNLSMSYYKDEQPVLNNLNFRIQAGEKIGIVGRTGAGKSSIITALFRLTPYEGDIVIDGINCKEIGLHELRVSFLENSFDQSRITNVFLFTLNRKRSRLFHKTLFSSPAPSEATWTRSTSTTTTNCGRCSKRYS